MTRACEECDGETFRLRPLQGEDLWEPVCASCGASLGVWTPEADHSGEGR